MLRLLFYILGIFYPFSCDVSGTLGIAEPENFSSPRLDFFPCDDCVMGFHLGVHTGSGGVFDVVRFRIYSSLSDNVDDWVMDASFGFDDKYIFDELDIDALASYSCDYSLIRGTNQLDFFLSCFS